MILLRDGSPLRLGGRALELLTILAERAGETVGNREILERVWPQTNIEEANVRVHIAALRKAIGDRQGGTGYIVNVAGRGYRLTAQVERVPFPEEVRVRRQAPAAPARLPPSRLDRVFGRSAVMNVLMERVRCRRFVTVVGPGGVGKTTVVLEAAKAMHDDYADGCCLVDLAPVQGSSRVLHALASSLGLRLTSESDIRGVTAFLRDQSMLLILDNCEHVLDGVAAMAEALLKAVDGVDIVATSREPLRAEGEWLIRLPVLELPRRTDGILAEEAMAYSAIALFAERAEAMLDDFKITDGNASAVAELCRRLDGLPLAIELAAAHVGTFGLQTIIARLDDRLEVLNRGRRSALPRQQTLRAALDWSYDLLGETDQTVLRCVSVFNGRFTLAAAIAVAAGAGVEAAEVSTAVLNLSHKSLVTATPLGAVEAIYGLLETTRVYARGRLLDMEGPATLLRPYAEHLCDIFEAEDTGWDINARSQWLVDYAHLVSDVRGLLEWAFGDGGDAILGIRLTVAAEPLWWEMALLDEQRELILRALSALPPDLDGRAPIEMQLKSALGYATFYTKGLVPMVQDSFAASLAIAEREGNAIFQLRTLWGMFGVTKVAGDYPRSLSFAERYQGVIRHRGMGGTPLLAGERMTAMALHHVGRHDQAIVHLMNVLSHDPEPSAVPRAAFEYDDHVAASAQRARILWIQGYPEKAAAAAERSLSAAIALKHELSICFVLAYGACPVALWNGDTALARLLVTMLLEKAAKHSFHYWWSWGRCYEARLTAGDDAAAPSPQQFASLTAMPLHVDLLSTLGPAFASEAATARAEQGLNGWCAAEVLRCEGERLKAIAGDETGNAEAIFERSLRIAREQGAAAWELRTATSLAHLYQEQGRIDEALDLMTASYGRFTEGFDTLDLLNAKRLLDVLGDATATGARRRMQ